MPNSDISNKILEKRKASSPLPLIFDSPHSGRDYPSDFNFHCNFKDLQRSEDNFIDQFFNMAPDYGAYYLGALFPRSYIDVNRSPDDIDPELIVDLPFKSKIVPGPRARAGIGLVRRLLKSNTPIYNKKLTLKELQQRIDTYYTPYHTALSELLDELYGQFGQIWHINCHSMPSGQYPVYAGRLPTPLPDFVIGDRDGTSCARELTFKIRDFLKDKGYSVALNDPYKGVEIIRKHGNPALNRHSLQLEINKKLYINERDLKMTKQSSTLQADIKGLIQFLADFVLSRQVPNAAD